MTGLARGAGGKTLAIIVVGAIALGAYAIGPAIGGGGPLNTKQAKRLFFSKRKSKKRFLAGRGKVRLSFASSGWVPEGGEPEPRRFVNRADFQLPGSGSYNPIMPLDLPQRLFNRPLRLASIDLCYETGPAVTLNDVRVARVRSSAADPLPTSDTVIEDSTPRTDETCRRYAPGAPAAIGPRDSLTVGLHADFGSASVLRLGRVGVVLTP